MAEVHMIRRKTLGIIGGMGSEAAARMFATVVGLTAALCDQDHLEIFLHNNTRVPDRTCSILGTGPSAVQELVRSAVLLKRMGADILAIPCMTSHHYLQTVSAEAGVEIVDGIFECVADVRKMSPAISRVGLLATTGTLRTDLFQARLRESAMEAVVPSRGAQESLVMQAIYASDGIKAGYTRGVARERLLAAIEQLIGAGAEAVIAGCTEIPLAVAPCDVAVPLIDSVEVLARAAVTRCGAVLRQASEHSSVRSVGEPDTPLSGRCR